MPLVSHGCFLTWFDLDHDKQHPTQQGPLDAVLNCLLHDPEYLSPQGMIQKSDYTPQQKNRVGIGLLKVLFGSSVAQLFVYCVSVILKPNIYIYIYILSGGFCGGF